MGGWGVGQTAACPVSGGAKTSSTTESGSNLFYGLFNFIIPYAENKVVLYV
jgi:hypothetical protein